MICGFFVQEVSHSSPFFELSHHYYSDLMAMGSWVPTFLRELSQTFRDLPKVNKYALASAASASLYFLLWPSLQKRLEFVALKNMHKLTEPASREHKEKLFSDLEDLPKVENAVVILELGIGTGINLKYYPRGVHVIASDLHALGEKEIADECAARGLNFKKYVVTGAEDLSMIESGSVSAVVMTLVLCSVENMEKALREIKRVSNF